jgi:uncharacterized caspase-like protein
MPLRFLALLVLTLLTLTSTAMAERRVALVLGNAAYENVPPLANPVRDAAAMRDRLQQLGFEVVAGLDLTKLETQELLAGFAKTVRGADIALFFYAGHGMQVSGRNYLLPVDAMLEDETSLDFEAVAVDFILRQMSRETAIRLVFLDACRDNPLAKVLAESGASAQSGLAEIEVNDGGAGTLVAFAASPNEVAYDGSGEHSPFSTALLAHIGEENLPLTLAMTRVTGDVFQATGGKQRPWVNVSFTDEVVLNRVAEPAPPPAVAAAASPDTGSDSRAAVATGDSAEIALRLLRQQIPKLETESAIFFDTPVDFGDPAIDGRSISQLIEGKPLFAPIEGLDKAVWDTQCTSCHEWNKERLCEQARTYERLDVSIMRLEHPYGSRFKVALANWARNGCQ